MPVRAGRESARMPGGLSTANAAVHRPVRLTAVLVPLTAVFVPLTALFVPLTAVFVPLQRYAVLACATAAVGWFSYSKDQAGAEVTHAHAARARLCVRVCLFVCLFVCLSNSLRAAARPLLRDAHRVAACWVSPCEVPSKYRAAQWVASAGERARPRPYHARVAVGGRDRRRNAVRRFLPKP